MPWTTMPWFELAVSLAAVLLAWALRPWRALPPEGPPWPWWLWTATLPLLWSADRLSAMPLAQPLPGACLLMLMAGWPLAVLALVPVAVATAWLGDLGAVAALHRYVWIGLVPASVGVVLGAGIRRWVPHHLFVYILGRGFLATVAANFVASALRTVLSPTPLGLDDGDLMLARWLAGWGDAFLTGMMVAIFVALRPQWLGLVLNKDKNISMPTQKTMSNITGQLHWINLCV